MGFDILILDLIVRSLARSEIFEIISGNAWFYQMYYRRGLKNLLEFTRSISIERRAKGLRPLAFGIQLSGGGCFIDGCRAAGVRR